MAFVPKHNQVGFLKKPKGSVGFEQIVDFLKGTHISNGGHVTEVTRSFLIVSQIFINVLEAKPVNTNLYLAYRLTKKNFGNMNRGFAGVYRPLLANMIAGHDENQGEPQQEPVGTYPPPNASVPSTSQP
ncbi:hypothetical protein Tco_1392058 [Tanacetum coccineum]